MDEKQIIRLVWLIRDGLKTLVPVGPEEINQFSDMRRALREIEDLCEPDD